jgi:hypothetical protein
MQNLKWLASCVLAFLALNIGMADSTPPEFAALLGTWETHITARNRNVCYPCRFVIQNVADNGDILGQFFQGDQLRPLQAKAVRNGDKIEVEGLFPTTGRQLSLVLEGNQSLSGWGIGTAPRKNRLLVQFHKVQ